MGDRSIPVVRLFFSVVVALGLLRFHAISTLDVGCSRPPHHLGLLPSPLYNCWARDPFVSRLCHRRLPGWADHQGAIERRERTEGWFAVGLWCGVGTPLLLVTFHGSSGSFHGYCVFGGRISAIPHKWTRLALGPSHIEAAEPQSASVASPSPPTPVWTLLVDLVNSLACLEVSDWEKNQVSPSFELEVEEGTWAVHLVRGGSDQF
jgi:hypothetical protein